jgi:hypothetical protein
MQVLDVVVANGHAELNQARTRADGEASEPVGNVHHPVAPSGAEVGGQVSTGPGGLVDQPVEQMRASSEGNYPAGRCQQLEVPQRRMIFQQHDADRAMRTEPVRQCHRKYVMVRAGQ